MRAVPPLALAFLLAACGGNGGGTAPPGPNQPPAFTSSASVSVVENSTTAYQASANDPDGSPITFSIAGGADAARFTITSGGQLSFAATANFELPLDADGNNTYDVTLQASDGRDTASLSVQITVTNSREGIAVRRVATGFNQPLFVTGIPGESAVFVLEKPGTVMRLDPATGAKSTLLTVSDISTDSERGLLGIAPAPDYASSRAVFIFVTAANGALQIREYRIGNAAFTPQLVLSTPHASFGNHNGGWIGFGPDGLLYAANGDGGGGGDPENNSQNPNSRLGKILRLSVSSGYAPAPGNPFAAGGGDPYVFALGLRNPYRASFFGNRLIIGDVGQGAREEIDILGINQGGTNYGWPFKEGTIDFRGGGPAGLTGPASDYTHGSGPRQGRSLIGGYVYGGPVASLQGQYVFGDFVSRNVWTVSASALVSGFVPDTMYENRNLDFTPDVGTIGQISSFGTDNAGNLFVVDIDGEIFMVSPA